LSKYDPEFAGLQGFLRRCADHWRQPNCFLLVRAVLCELSPKHCGYEVGMAYKETFWMACDSTEQLRAEYGPFHTRGEAEREARRLGFGFLLRYEHMIGEKEDIQEVRCIFIELHSAPVLVRTNRKLHTRCASCGESSVHDESWRAEVWADIHEFEHSRHLVRLFEQTRAEGLKEIEGWRDTCA
jgi:hypothetical protein